MIVRSALLMATALCLSACSSEPDYDPSEYDEDGNWVYSKESTYFDDLEEEKGGETYSEFDDRRDSYEGSRGEYGGYGCTVDCSGHEAGYNWAEERGIDDPDQCGGNSWSFEEGCRAYAEENGY